jgi:putative membrane protein
MIFIARGDGGGKVASLMKAPFSSLLARWLILALGVVIATRLVPGIHCRDAGALLEAVVLLSLFNALLRPVLVVFTLPFIILTMGIGILVINAILFLFVGRIVSGFEVDGFWPAVGGSLVLSLTNLVVTAFLRSSRPPPPPRPPGGPGSTGGDVIDI